MTVFASDLIPCPNDKCGILMPLVLDGNNPTTMLCGRCGCQFRIAKKPGGSNGQDEEADKGG